MFYTDVCLLFGIRWVASSCQDTMSIISKHLNQQGALILNYIDDFGLLATSQAEAHDHFDHLQDLMDRLGLV